MSTPQLNQWIWSDEHKDHYCLTLDTNGQYQYQWAAGGTQSAHTGETALIRSDSASAYDANMAPPAMIANLRFRGTPDRGWYDLDPSYRMRTRSEAHTFFTKGRVFAMLWAETASDTMQTVRNGTENTAITVGRFGQNVFSQIRRFVVMKVNRDRHFLYACAISTYGRRGTLKYGCNASEHAIVYLTGTSPVYLQGELERGLTKDPIEIEPAEPTETMEPASRLRFGKIHSIEWNVKVREIGMISRKHMSKLARYYKQEENNGFDNDDDYSDDDGEEDNEDNVATSQPVSSSQAAYGHVQYTGSTQAQQSSAQPSYTQSSYDHVSHTGTNYPPTYGQGTYANLQPYQYHR